MSNLFLLQTVMAGKGRPVAGSEKVSIFTSAGELIQPLMDECKMIPAPEKPARVMATQNSRSARVRPEAKI